MQKLFSLLQLADSALPIGGFSFSSGMESASKFSAIQTHQQLKDYLIHYLEGLGSWDLPYLNSFFAAKDDADLLLIHQQWHASILCPEMQHASQSQGRSFYRLLQKIRNDVRMHIFEFKVNSKKIMHYLPILTLCLRKLDFSQEQIASLYLHNQCRDQISAAVRLGLIGSLTGQKIHYQLHSHCHKLTEKTKLLNMNSAYKTSPMIEIIQCLHKDIYAKMFQN